MSAKEIVLLCRDGASSRIIYHALAENFKIKLVICEQSPSKWLLIKRRYNKLGAAKVIGQLFFQVFVQKMLKHISSSRIEQIMKYNELSVQPIEDTEIHFVDSVNSRFVVEFLQRANPYVVIVNGTRIINENILNCVNAPFINTHMGITPKYRGGHGAYWALVNKDCQNCGVTVHLVDKGIDTGKIIAQSIISTSKDDNFTTYPYLQLVAAIPLLIICIKRILNNEKLAILENDLKSILWYHPTLWEYFYFMIFRGVR